MISGFSDEKSEIRISILNPIMRGTFLVAVSIIFPKIKSRANLLWTLHLSSQTEKQLVGDRVHQVQEGGVLVKDVVERRSFQAEILE